ncbi:hypothetical protein HID58_072170 [Brassica napus]|uniref:TIR domain-containing protein n=1 Tax=Brassica napus TaxID=3708 RepID=A0ABQ7Z3T7_BRANA|nr:hypothetical protein HID58_072170 [Brassica napus]
MNTVLKKRSCFKTKVKSLRLFESRSSLSSSFSFPPKKYDVFLSFRGADTRKNFVSFLYKELETKGIQTFKDDKALVRGRPIAPELVQAIQGTRIAVVVVSPTYSASYWCLEELVKILKLEKKGLLIVVPIFYEVDPCQVRRQKGEVAEHKDDATLVDGITKRISEILSTETQSNGNNLIGFDKHMKELYPLLDLNSDEGVQVSGIWGRGSNGISALARGVYQDISPKFEAHCFLEDLRKISLDCQKSHLQEELLSKMEGPCLSTKSSRMCFDAIKARLGNKKVLLVANDVDKIEKLDALANEFSWFGPGSRIIIVTQDKQLLSSWGVKSVYEVELLRCCEVGKLWRSEAFKQKQDPECLEGSMNLPGSNLFSSLKYLMNYLSDRDQLRERLNEIIYSL